MKFGIKIFFFVYLSLLLYKRKGDNSTSFIHCFGSYIKQRRQFPAEFVTARVKRDYIKGKIKKGKI